MPSEPRHRTISRELLAEIAAGKHGADGRLPSEAQLVERYRVSRPTASRALRDLQQQGIIERRVGSGNFVAMSRPSVRSGATRELGLLSPGLSDSDITSQFCGDISSLARIRDYLLLWDGTIRPRLTAEDLMADCEKRFRQFIERQVAGVFFVPFEFISDHESLNRRFADGFRDSGIAVVLLDHDLLPYPHRSDFDLVGVDNFEGGFCLAEHLIKLGAKRLLFVQRTYSASTLAARIAGAREAAKQYGVVLPATFVRDGNPSDPKFIRSLLSRPRPDALMCANDRTASLVSVALTKMRVKIPEDVRVTGFDDVQLAALAPSPLTTMHQPCREIGDIAFRTMLDRIAEPNLPVRTVTVKTKLTVRESCGAYLRRG